MSAEVDHATHADDSHHEGNQLRSDRYELDDLFHGEGPETKHLMKVMGVVVLLVLLALALAFPLKFLN
jgi:hypothetical protein